MTAVGEESFSSSSSKIQLDNYQDLEYIESIIKNNFNYQNEEIKERLLESIFDVLHQNIQINNQDYDEFYHRHPDNDVEHVNEDLINELEQAQSETDRMLVELCQMRKEIIPEIKSIYGSKLMESVTSVPLLSSSFSFSSHQLEEDWISLEKEEKKEQVDDNVPFLSEESINKFSDQLSRLKELNENTPQVLAKLQRARMVLTEQTDKLLQNSDSSFYHANGGSNNNNNNNNNPINNGNRTENLSEIFSRKFVAKRQTNLAEKLKQQLFSK